jgi:hypothetical protein
MDLSLLELVETCVTEGYVRRVDFCTGVKNPEPVMIF